MKSALTVLFNMPMRHQGRNISCSIEKGTCLYDMEDKVVGVDKVEMIARQALCQEWLIRAEITPVSSNPNI